MGQKVNPNGLRYGIYRNWNSLWYANNKNYPILIINDNILRSSIYKKFGRKFQIVNIKIIRRNEKVIVEIFTGKASVIMGENQKIFKHINKFIRSIVKKEDSKLKFSIELIITQIRNLHLNAQLVANDIAVKLENRGNYKILQKIAISNAMRDGALGIKTRVSGRLNGVDIARSEGYSKGKIPLNTLRSKIEYGFAEAITTYGVLGIKIWICKGSIISKNHYNNSKSAFKKGDK